MIGKETIFSKIVHKETGTKLIYQDNLVSAFNDASPKANIHIIIVPNKLIPTVNQVEKEDEITLGRLFTVARKIAKQKGIDSSGYRLIVNCNKDAGQEISHLHMHLLGGQKLSPL